MFAATTRETLLGLALLALPAAFVALTFWLLARRRGRHPALLALGSIGLGLVISVLVYSVSTGPPQGTLTQSSTSPGGTYVLRLYQDSYGLGPDSGILLVKVAGRDGEQRLIHVDKAENADMLERTIVWRDDTHVVYTRESGSKVALDVVNAPTVKLDPDDLDRIAAAFLGGLAGAAAALAAVAAVTLDQRHRSHAV